MAADKIQPLSGPTAQPEPQLLPLAGGGVFSQNRMLQPQHFSCFSPKKYWNWIFKLSSVAERIYYFSRLIITVFLLHWYIIISFRNTRKGKNFPKAILNVKFIHYNRTLFLLQTALGNSSQLSLCQDTISSEVHWVSLEDTLKDTTLKLIIHKTKKKAQPHLLKVRRCSYFKKMKIKSMLLLIMLWHFDKSLSPESSHPLWRGCRKRNFRAKSSRFAYALGEHQPRSTCKYSSIRNTMNTSD